jgi:hypothetical protein
MVHLLRFVVSHWGTAVSPALTVQAIGGGAGGKRIATAFRDEMQRKVKPFQLACRRSMRFRASCGRAGSAASARAACGRHGVSPSRPSQGIGILVASAFLPLAARQNSMAAPNSPARN